MRIFWNLVGVNLKILLPGLDRKDRKNLFPVTVSFPAGRISALVMGDQKQAQKLEKTTDTKKQLVDRRNRLKH